MIFLAVLLVMSVEPKPPIDCEMVRAKVAEHGLKVAYLWAFTHGYSRTEISRIRKMCGI